MVVKNYGYVKQFFLYFILFYFYMLLGYPKAMLAAGSAWYMPLGNPKMTKK
jgi:hypothetical protein